MTKQEFEGLQQKFNHSGMTLKSFPGQAGIAYSTYNCPDTVSAIDRRMQNYGYILYGR